MTAMMDRNKNSLSKTDMIQACIEQGLIPKELFNRFYKYTKKDSLKQLYNTIPEDIRTLYFNKFVFGMEESIPKIENKIGSKPVLENKKPGPKLGLMQEKKQEKSEVNINNTLYKDVPIKDLLKNHINPKQVYETELKQETLNKDCKEKEEKCSSNNLSDKLLDNLIKKINEIYA